LKRQTIEAGFIEFRRRLQFLRSSLGSQKIADHTGMIPYIFVDDDVSVESNVFWVKENLCTKGGTFFWTTDPHLVWWDQTIEKFALLLLIHPDGLPVMILQHNTTRQSVQLKRWRNARACIDAIFKPCSQLGPLKVLYC